MSNTAIFGAYTRSMLTTLKRGGNTSYVTFDGKATWDGGNNWLGGSGPPRPSIFSETLLVDVHATSPNKILAVAGQNVLFSNDGVSYSVISSLAGDLWNIEMVSESTGFVASMNGPKFISKTIDGGNTWLPVFDPGMGIGALDFVSESTGWVVGLDPHDYSSHVYRTVMAASASGRRAGGLYKRNVS